YIHHADGVVRQLPLQFVRGNLRDGADLPPLTLPAVEHLRTEIAGEAVEYDHRQVPAGLLDAVSAGIIENEVEIPIVGYQPPRPGGEAAVEGDVDRTGDVLAGEL